MNDTDDLDPVGVRTARDDGEGRRQTSFRGVDEHAVDDDQED